MVGTPRCGVHSARSIRGEIVGRRCQTPLNGSRLTETAYKRWEIDGSAERRPTGEVRRFENRRSLLLLLTPGLLFERNTAGAFLKRFEMRRVLLIIFLMIILGRIKFHGRENFRRDGTIEFTGVRQFLF